MKLQVYLPSHGPIGAPTDSPTVAASQARGWAKKGWSALIIERRQQQPTLDGEGGEPDIIIEVKPDLTIQVHSGEANWIDTVRSNLEQYG